MYTVELLRQINLSYDSQHRVTNDDVEKSNMYRNIIESSRTQEKPQVGDIIEYTSKHGDYYRNAHIERVRDGIELCEHPSVPFIYLNKERNNIHCSTSGGAWSNLPKEANLKLIGQREKTFCDWGHCGACGNGAIEFQATVNVWEFQDIQKYPYTTKTHRKEYVSVNPSAEEKNIQYKYHGNHTAWEREIDFQAWLKTFKGVTFEGNMTNQIVVWCYKEEFRYTENIELYDNIENAFDDVRLCNGKRPCKRVYDDVNFKVLTYLPPYQYNIELDWRTHKENEYNRKQLEKLI